MTVFGDAEPEDAWQADDPIPVLIDNLERRMAHLRNRDEAPPLARLDELMGLLAHERGIRRLDPFEAHRADLIGAGIAHVLRRLEAADG